MKYTTLDGTEYTFFHTESLSCIYLRVKGVMVECCFTDSKYVVYIPAVHGICEEQAINVQGTLFQGLGAPTYFDDAVTLIEGPHKAYAIAKKLVEDHFTVKQVHQLRVSQGLIT